MLSLGVKRKKMGLVWLVRMISKTCSCSLLVKCKKGFLKEEATKILLDREMKMKNII